MAPSVGEQVSEQVQETVLNAIEAITDRLLTIREMQQVRAAALDLAAWADVNIGINGGRTFGLLPAREVGRLTNMEDA